WQPSLRGVEAVADLPARLVVGVKAAHLEFEQLSVSVLECRGLRVRRLLVVVESEVAARAFDRLRVLVFAERPARDVHLVRPLVAEVGAAVLPEPVPVVMKMILVERALPGRP